MFGIGGGNNKLFTEGASAKGVVIQNKTRSTVGNGIVPEYHVKIRVKFDDGTTTEFKAQLNAREVGRHLEGAILPVRFDPANHSKIVVDLPALAGPKVDLAAKKRDAIARAEERLAQANGATPTVSTLAGVPSRAASSQPPTDAQLQGAWNALRAAQGDLSAMNAFWAAKKSADVAEQVRLKSFVTTHNEQVEALENEFKRLSALRPDWTAAQV
jgi:hypothetical protein